MANLTRFYYKDKSARVHFHFALLLYYYDVNTHSHQRYKETIVLVRYTTNLSTKALENQVFSPSGIQLFNVWMAHPDVMKAGCNENKRKVASLGTYASKRFRWPHVKDSGSHHIFRTLSSFQLNPLIYTLSASLPWERWNDPGLLRTMGRGIFAFHNCFCFCSSSIAFLENLIFKIILFAAWQCCSKMIFFYLPNFHLTAFSCLPPEVLLLPV